MTIRTHLSRLLALFIVALVPACGGKPNPHVNDEGLFAPPEGGFAIRLPESAHLQDSSSDSMGKGLMSHRYIFRNGLEGAVLVEHAPVPVGTFDADDTSNMLDLMTGLFFDKMTIIRKAPMRVMGHPAERVYVVAEVEGDKAIGRGELIVASGRMYHLMYLKLGDTTKLAELDQGDAEVFFRSFHLTGAAPR